MSSILVRADGPFLPPRPQRVPGDKSVAHRAVLLAAVAQGRSRLSGLPGGLDVKASLGCIRTLGAQTETAVGAEAVVTIVPAVSSSPGVLDCANSGTTMRLLCGLLAGRDVVASLDGDASLRRRPMGRVAEPLTKMGGRISTTDGHGPVRIEGAKLHGIDYLCPVPSAQVKSALLLAGMTASGTTTVRLPGPSRDHTERLLTALGVPVTVEGFSVSVSAAEVPGFDMAVPGDISSAAFLFGAAAATGGDVTVEAVGLNPTRTGVLDVIAAMGATVEVTPTSEDLGEPVGTVRVRGSVQTPLILVGDAVADTIDEIPLLCALAACVDGVSEIRDAEELRTKESDRLATIAAMLEAFGVDVDVRRDGISIGGRPPAPPTGTPRIDSAGDHRIAMAAAVAACGLGAGVVDGWEAAAVSYPEFAYDLQRGGIRVARVD